MDPLTVIAIAQATISVYNMLQPGTSDLGTLMKLQTQLLLKLSQQIAAVQEGIESLLKQVEQLQISVDAVPDKTVVANYRAQILGAQQSFIEYSKLYSETRDKEGVARAQEKYAGAFFNYVLEPLYAARTDLLAAYNTFTITPIASLALWLEVHGMIFAGTEPKLALERLLQYKRWFENLLSEELPQSLVNAIKATASRRSSRYGGSRYYSCVREIREIYETEYEMTESGLKSQDVYRDTHYYLEEDQVDIIASDFVEASLRTAILEMTALGIFNDYNKPQLFSFVPKPLFPQYSTVGNAERRRLYEEEQFDVEALSACTPEIRRLREQTAEHAVMGTQTDLVWMSLKSYEFSARTSFAFLTEKLDKYEKVLQTYDK